MPGLASARRCARPATLDRLSGPGGQGHNTGVDDFYNDLAHDYEWLFPDEAIGSAGTIGVTSPGSKDILEGILNTLPRGARVLDCACGIGADAVALSRSGYNVVASDGSASMVAEARRRSRQLGLEINITQSRWQELSERVPGAFDLILCLGNAMVHAGIRSNMLSSLEGIKKVLSPGGILVVDSRNWELLYDSRPRIMPGNHVIERDGVRCSSLYIWTVPGDFKEPCRAEIVLLFEGANSAVTHRRYVIDFAPFRHEELTDAIQSAGLAVVGNSYEADSPFYTVTAAMQ
jgi:glycine/sarcosine N-methyltransferase